MHVSRPSRLPRDPEAALWKALPRNLTGMLLFELTWGFGLPFGLYASMVPSYLTVLGVSKSLMGFVQSFWTILIPLQLLASHLFSPKRRMRSVITLYMLATGSRLAYDVLVVAVPVMWTPSSLVTFFVLANISYVGLLLLGQSLYMGVLTDNVPRKRRGWVFGLRTVCNGTGGVLMGLGASWVLHHWPSPLSYRVSFLICDTFWTLSSISLFLIRDKPAKALRVKAAGFLRSLLGKLRILLANPNYRIFLFFNMLNTVAQTICSFIIPYAAERLHVPDEHIAWLTMIFLASSVVFGLFMGRLADRVGYRSVGAAQSLLLVTFFLLAMSSRSFIAICVAWVLYSIVNFSGSFILVNMSVELCPSLGASDLTALGGTLLVPFVAVISPLAGTVIDTTGSYLAVFFIGVTIATIALFGFAILVREPRTGRLYDFKQIPMQ